MALLLALLLALLPIMACHTRAWDGLAPTVAGHRCIEEPLRHAQHFSLERCGPIRRLTVREPSRGSGEVYRYVLVPHDEVDLVARVRRELQRQSVFGVTVLTTPVKRVATMSLPYPAYLEQLEVLDSWVGTTERDLFLSPALRARISQGQVASLGYGRGEQAVEPVLNVRPDVVFLASTGSPAWDREGRLHRLGVPVAMMAEWMEATPLGRAEWLRFVGAFVGRETAAASLFDALEARYREAQRVGQQHEGGPDAPLPAAFTGLPWSGIWYTPGNQSYMANFLADAGARYAFEDVRGAGAAAMSIEAVLVRAHDADVWVSPMPARSLDELERLDPRAHLFRAFRTGWVVNFDARTGPHGANEYWERGELEPDVVLRDLTRIMRHRDDGLHFYRTLPRSGP